MLHLAIALSLEITNKENCFEKQGLDFKTQNAIDKMSKKNDIKLVSRNAAAL